MEDETYDVLHTCCYENQPTEIEVEDLKRELATDPEFLMIGVSEYEIGVMSRMDNPEWFEALGIPEEIDETEYDNNICDCGGECDCE